MGLDADQRIISADDHMDIHVLPPELWTTRLPRALRDAAPHVVDWQFVARGRGVMDVAYYLTQSGATDIAAAHERTLVEQYHEALCRGGVSDYSLENCWEDYRRFAYYALVYPVFTAGTADPDNEDQRAAIAVILERAVSAILRLDGAEFS